MFWQIAAHRPRPAAQVRAELEAALREQGAGEFTPKPDGGFTGGVAVRQVEAIGFFRATMSWLSFSPRPWVGVLGLFGVACIFGCLIVSLFFPGGTEMGVSDLPTRSPATGAQR